MSVEVDSERRGRVRAPGAPGPESLFARRSERFIQWFAAVFWPFARVWFRARVLGLERLPGAPCLFVGNHSGFGAYEIAVMLTAFWRRFGPSRKAVGLAHDLGFIPVLGPLVLAIGGLPARPDHGRAALSAGYDVLVFPGGDVDALRPFSARDEVRFGGRKGFVRLALEQQVPIVPMVTAGSHAQFLFLPGGEWVARALGLSRHHRLKTAPVWPALLLFLAALPACALGLLSWGWAAVAFLCAVIPNPTRIDVRMLPALDVRALLEEEGGDEGRVAERVRRLLEAELREMSGGRRTPWG